MEMPPGPLYLFKLLPFFLVPPVTVIAILRIDQVFLGTKVPTWLYIAAGLLVRPFLSIFQRYYTRYLDSRAADANAAFIIPHVEEKRPGFAGLSIMSALVKDFKNAYPGECFCFLLGLAFGSCVDGLLCCLPPVLC